MVPMELLLLELRDAVQGIPICEVPCKICGNPTKKNVSVHMLS